MTQAGDETSTNVNPFAADPDEGADNDNPYASSDGVCRPVYQARL